MSLAAHGVYHGGVYAVRDTSDGYEALTADGVVGTGYESCEAAVEAAKAAIERC